MPSKIPNLFQTNELIISQGKHTQGWGTMSASVAIDIAYMGDLICPFDGCEVRTYEGSNSGEQSYFTITLPDGSIIICVHGFPIRTGKFNKGEVIGKCRWHHWHLSIIVNSQLSCILDYIDRSIRMYTQEALYGTIDHPDGKWSTYQDKFLNIQNQDDMQIQEILTELRKYLNGDIQTVTLPINNEWIIRVNELNRAIQSLEEKNQLLTVQLNSQPKVSPTIINSDIQSTQKIPPISIPISPIQKANQELLAENAAVKINEATGLKVEAVQVQSGVGYIVNKLFDRLISSRLWVTVGGTYFVQFVGKDTIITVGTLLILGSIYMITEYLKRYKK